MNYKAMVIGVSAGGIKALNTILAHLPPSLPFAILVVIHRTADSDDYLERSLNEKCRLHVKQAEDKEKIQAGTIYFAPPDYHLLVEDDHTLSLSIDEAVNYARPSIDVLFDTAAEAYGPEVVGVILTGANTDGSKGLAKIKQLGGFAVVQEPETAEMPAMPLAAIATVPSPHMLPLDKIGQFITEIGLNSEVT